MYILKYCSTLQYPKLRYNRLNVGPGNSYAGLKHLTEIDVARDKFKYSRSRTNNYFEVHNRR